MASAQTDKFTIIDLTDAKAVDTATMESKQVAVALSNEPSAPGLVMTIEKGDAGYPGFKYKYDTPLDLSAYGHVGIKLTNLGSKRAFVALRLDNAGDWKKNPWNSENIYIEPGQTKVGIVRFGYSWGKPAYPLDAAKITQIMVFSGKVKNDEGIKVRIEELYAAGKPGEQPPVKPENVRIFPNEQGVILGKGVKVSDGQFFTRDLTVKTLGDGSLVVDITKSGQDAKLGIKPPVGMWNLKHYLQLNVTIKNTGKSAITPKIQMASKRGNTQWVTASTAIAPGASSNVIVPFFDENNTWNGDDHKKSGPQMESNNVRAISFTTTEPKAGDQMTIQAITCELAYADTPNWLGKRPPVEGDWSQTLNENFDSNNINEKLWRIYGPNYWDKRTHFSKEGLILKDGKMHMRITKKRGHHNDDPQNERVTDYQVGFMDSYGKWVQRYGYFEARMKLPTAPGLWPAFWMMPDRGEASGPQWVRQDTAKGGMEFDIMEHLTRWGPYRYNVAMHWDGYKKGHKAIGSSCVYAKPDKDGFITAGVLWVPGKLVYYANGKEVGRWENERVCDQPMDLMFDLVTGGWDNDPIDDKQLPADFVIDYVRAWQRKDLATDVDGYK
jgi:beta-glucanase (GH16 family)